MLFLLIQLTTENNWFKKECLYITNWIYFWNPYQIYNYSLEKFFAGSKKNIFFRKIIKVWFTTLNWTLSICHVWLFTLKMFSGDPSIDIRGVALVLGMGVIIMLLLMCGIGYEKFVHGCPALWRVLQMAFRPRQCCQCTNNSVANNKVHPSLSQGDISSTVPWHKARQIRACNIWFNSSRVNVLFMVCVCLCGINKLLSYIQGGSYPLFW